MAFTIMLAHICSENIEVHPLIKHMTSVYNFGVPFFFACSGFLFFFKLQNTGKTNHKAIYFRFTRRILLMYFVWSIIYFSFVLLGWIQKGVSHEEIVMYFHKAIVFSTYATIWFLPSLWIGISIVYIIFVRLNTKFLIVVAIVFYLFGALGFSYLQLAEGTFIEKYYLFYRSIFYTSRNGVFFGFPFVAIGALIAFNATSKNTDLIFTLIFSCLYIMEAVIIKYKLKANVDMGLLLVPSVFFMLRWLVNIELPNRKIFIRLRNLSMLIFLGQRLFITAIPSVLPQAYMELITRNNYIGLIIFLLQVLIFSILIENLSRKYSWLKILW